LRVYSYIMLHSHNTLGRDDTYTTILNYYLVCTRYCTAGVDKQVRSTAVYHSKQCGIVLKPPLRSRRFICFMSGARLRQKFPKILAMRADCGLKQVKQQHPFSGRTHRRPQSRNNYVLTRSTVY